MVVFRLIVLAIASGAFAYVFFQDEVNKYVLQKPPEFFEQDVKFKYNIAKRIPAVEACRNLRSYKELLELEQLAGTNLYREIANAKIVQYTDPCAEEKAMAKTKREEEKREYVRQPVVEEYQKPEAAPNGSVWPSSADYIDGYKKLNDSGKSSVTIDNSDGSSDVMVKLVYLEEEESYPVRTSFIPKGGVFKMSSVDRGRYDVRYKQLENGALYKSEPFELKEERVGNQTSFSNYRLTLYTVKNGNTSPTRIGSSEF